MEMLVYSGSGSSTKVHTNVERIGVECFGERLFTGTDKRPELYGGGLRQSGYVGSMHIRNNHQMTVVVRIEIEHDKVMVSPKEYEVTAIVGSSRFGAEDTPVIFIVNIFNILCSPRGPELLGHVLLL